MPHAHLQPLPPLRTASQEGFTLVELTVVLTIISIIVGTLMLKMLSGSAISAQETSLKRMQAIEQALASYWMVNGRIPCPARGNAALNANNFGAEAGTPGNCRNFTGVNNAYVDRGRISATCDNWNTACPTTCTGDCGAVMGVVPVRALNLPDEYALDGWNRRISYVVDERYTEKRPAAARPPALIVTEDHVAPASAIEIGRFPALLISHGKMGSHAYPADGALTTARPTRNLTPAEEHNVTHTAFNNRFVLKPFMPDLPSNNNARFDQLVRPIALP